MGVFVILRLADFQSYGREEVWQPISLGERMAVEIDGVSCEPFHAEPPRDDGDGPRRQAAQPSRVAR